VFNGLPGLDVMRSKSVEQLSSILLIFEPGTDLMEARQLVQERLTIGTPTLPTWAAPPMMMPPLSSTARTMKIGISSKEHSVIELSMIGYWKIRERLLRVPGVANVAMCGEQIQMPQVRRAGTLAAHGVTVDEVCRHWTPWTGMIQYSEDDHRPRTWRPQPGCTSAHPNADDWYVSMLNRRRHAVLLAT
jgi:Cu/Ag efflux pump CusA